ncbi:ras GTPase-activating protein 2 [Salvelinus sp. IW2-2015]|uniref:ras GTPase-activating protein 2 n=1 Tax=Salvelinus sp. IW2-2015 TaxID=2691554 RepID=UPI0038D3C582
MAEEEDTRIRILQSLRGKICEGKNLGPCSGPNRQRDLCTFCTISLDQEEVFRTKVFDKSLSPFYGEDFYFEIPRPFQCLSFYVFAKGVFQRDLPVGKVSIRKEELFKFSGKEHWFGLQPVDPNSEVQGKVHLEMRLNELIIENGSMCQQLLVRIIECQGLPLISGQNCDPYATVSLVGPARSDQKKTKVKKKTSDPQFEETFNFEVTRPNSYTKKSNFQVEEEDIEKLEINRLTHSYIAHWVYSWSASQPMICESNKTCEIDPIKLKEGDNVEVNKENLQGYVQKVFSSITQSSSSCPPLMCDVFRSLRHMASKRFPDDPHVQYSAVSSFVFLRFFAVAVLSPHTFQLRPHHPDLEVSRTLTLISKTIQTLGSWGSLSKNKLSSFKESYMYDFFKSFQEDKCIEKVKKFLDEISSNISKESSGVEDSVVLKEGEIQKRAQGRKRIGKRNFKKRWLRVTNRELSYHKHRGKEALCIIPVKNIRAVEKLYESAFNRKNMFQVLHNEKPLYVQAGNCVEASEWVEVLSQVSRCNPDRLGTFHPSAYVAGAWLCCRSLSDSQPGCKPCTPTLLANLQLDIDCDRETERIFSLLTSSYSKLQKMEDACASIAVYQGPPREQDDYSLFTIQDPKETFHTVRQITHILEELQREHDTRSGTAQYGSQENPIVGKTS